MHTGLHVSFLSPCLDFLVTSVCVCVPPRPRPLLHTSVQQIQQAGTLLVKHLPKAGQGAYRAV